MKEKILRLAELQAIDLRIRMLENEMSKKPAAINDRRNVLAERHTAIAELSERKSALEKRKRDLEAEVADELQRIKDRQAKLMDIQTNREHQSLLKEIESSKKSNRLREEEILQLMDEMERMQNTMKENANLAKAEEELIAEDSIQVEKELLELTAQKAEIEKERNFKAEEVVPELMAKYNILRTRRNGMAVVPVTRGVCQGCFMNIQPQLFNEIMAGTALVACPNCQRLLYYRSEDQEK